MLGKLKRAWNTHRLQIADFIAMCLIVAVFAFRLIGVLIYWQKHQNQPIEEWMCLGYVNHSHHVDIGALNETIGLPPYPPDRRKIGEIVYVGIGYAFSNQIQYAADMVGNALWLIIALIAAYALGRRLFTKHDETTG